MSVGSVCVAVSLVDGLPCQEGGMLGCPATGGETPDLMKDLDSSEL